ncbi:MAG: cytochrome c-type biogenesis protein CcmH, partial [Burkholderiales bacterium]
QLYHQLRCVVCNGQSLADSNAPLAEQMRKFIKEQIKQGKSNAEIIDYLIQRYGESIYMQPPFNKHTLLLWIGPFLAIILGIRVIFKLR